MQASHDCQDFKRTVLHKSLHNHSCMSNTFPKQEINAVCTREWNWVVSQGLPNPVTIIDVVELKSSSYSYIFQGLIKNLLTPVMVQVVGRAWTWLWASDLENQGIQSKSQPASLSLLWLSPQTINGSCFWKQAQISLKHVPVSWNSLRVYFKWGLCFSTHPLFWSILFVSLPVPLYGSCRSCWVHVMPIITHFNQTPQMNYSLTFYWPYVKSKLFRVSFLEKICQLVYWPP